MNWQTGIAVLALCPAGVAQAQLPLTIEQLLIEPAKWQVAAAFDYYTTSAGPWVSQRLSGGRTALRYGIAPGLEVNAGIQVAESLQRLPGYVDRNGSQRITAGLNWLLKRETISPAVLLELRAELAYRDNRRALAGGQIMLTSYKSVDPLVLSLTAMWDQRRSFVRGEDRIQPGHAWRLEPAVNFAVNPRVTLLGGLSISRRQASRINERAVSTAIEQVALRAGMGYALDHSSQIFLTGDFASNEGGSGVTLQWFHDF